MEQPIESPTIKQYLLSIRISSEGFNLTVFDESGVLLSTKKVTMSIFSLSADEIIKIMLPETELNYRSVRLIYESDIYTFIPAPVFKMDEAADMLHFQFKPDKKNQIILNRIPKWQTVDVFSIPKTVNQALIHLFPNAIVEHHLSYFLNEFVKTQSENTVYIQIRSNIMDVVVLTNGNIQLINSYSFNTPEDFTYYTLNIFDKLSLETEKCNVVLFNSERRPELLKTLENYLKVIKGEKTGNKKKRSQLRFLPKENQKLIWRITFFL